MGDFVTGRGFVSDTSCVSHADQAQAEYEASKRNEPKASHKRRRTVSNGLAPKWNDYETNQRMTRIHKSVTHIQHEIETLERIVPANRAGRRAKEAVLRRMRHAIDRMPNR